MGVSDKFEKEFTSNGKFSVLITDLAGNTSVASGEVKRIDRNKPVISGISDGGAINGPVTISVFDPTTGGFADGFNRSSGLVVNDASVVMADAPGKTYVATFTEEGVYNVVATDKAGNSSTLTFKIDTTAPSAPVVTSPTAGQEFGSDIRKITTAWDASTDMLSGVKQYEVKYTYMYKGKEVESTRLESGLSRVQGLSGDVLSDFTVEVRAQDHAGNWSDWSEPVTYYYGVDAPAVPGDDNDADTDTDVDTGIGTSVGDGASGTGGDVITDDERPDELERPSFRSAVPAGATFFGYDVSDLVAQANNAPVDTPEVAGVQDSRDTLGATSKAVEATPEGWKIFGMAWYWWLLIVAAVAGAGWWLIGAARRRREDEPSFLG